MKAVAFYEAPSTAVEACVELDGIVVGHVVVHIEDLHFQVGLDRLQ